MKPLSEQNHYEILETHVSASREEIERSIYAEDAGPASNAVDALVCRLRKKIDADGATPLLHTRRGAGYQLHATGT